MHADRQRVGKAKGALLPVLFPALLLLFAIPVLSQRDLSIAEIQGDKNMSPVEGQRVRTTGVVTARTRTGFFIQSPEEKADGNPMTSDGIFVFTRTEPTGDAAVGNLVTVTATVEEFRPRSEPMTLPVTEISFQSGGSVDVVSKGNVLPKPVTLTTDDFKGNAIDQLERFEGMRVAIAELSVVAPTNGRVDIATASSESNGTFYGVLKGVPRPFREPGFDIFDYVLLGEREKAAMKKDFPKLPIYDANPERLRIESTAQLGAQTLNVSTFTDVKGITGVMHFAYRTSTIFVDPDSKPSVSGSFKPLALPATNDRLFSVVGMNLENFFDDKDDPEIKEDIVTAEAFERRLKKISLAVREILNLPDVIGLVETENLATAKRLAERLNADVVAAGKLDPKYEAFLVDGNDGRGIDNGFLVKTSRVKVVEAKQFGKEEKYKHPETKEDIFLNDRPPLMLRASIADPRTNQPFEFTAVANHLKSFLGFNDPRQMDNVRMKKRLQAEFLAKWVQVRQKANPAEKIILLGDFNAFQFNDGVVDLIGILLGKPAARDAVLNFSVDLVDPDLVNLVDVIDQKQRYSYVFDGNAQVLDHMIVTAAMKKHVLGFGYARLNADFPETLRNDPSRPERFSDHDPAVAFITFDDIASPQKP